MEQQKDLIQLATANVTQNTTGHEKTEWIVKENITEATLASLPKHLSESDIFAIIGFARKYELSALNIGINFQKGKQNEVLVNKLKVLESACKEMADENERLSGLLENLIGEKE